MRRCWLVALTFAVVLCMGAAAAQNPTLEQVLEKHYEAIGGLQAWQQLQSMKATGKMSMGPMEAPVTLTAKRPDKLRIDFVVQGMTGTQAYDGETAWMLMPFMGKTEAEVMAPDQAKAMVDEADIDGPLVGYEEEGQKVELLGQEEVEGTPAYKLKVTRPSGDVSFYYLDSEYYVPIRVEGTRTIQGKEVQFETTLSDYKEVGGLLMPHSISSKAKEAPSGQSLTLEEIEVNLNLEDGQFKMPEKKEAPKP